MPVVIAMGDFVCGVTSWAFRLREAFRNHPDYTIVLLNCSKTGNKVGSFDLEVTSAARMRDTLKRLAPAVVVPNFVFDVYSVCADLIDAGHELRCVGFCRADSDREYYDPLAFYEPVVSHFAAVSPECAANLAKRLPNRANDISIMPTGVWVPKQLKRTYQNAPVRIVYGGRIVQEQKRVLDFVPLVKALLDRNIDFVFDIAGTGRQLPDLKEAMAEVRHGDRVHFHGKIPFDKMDAVWREHDVFIQTSDYEGTSNSMLESMAQGAIPVMTRTQSGVDGIIEHGRNGFLVDVADMDAMADVIADLSRQSSSALERMGRAAHEMTHAYSMERYVERFSVVLDMARHCTAPSWPAGKSKEPDFDVIGIKLRDMAKDEVGPELIANGSFTDWADGLPAEWAAPKGLVKQAEGEASAEIRPHPKAENVHLHQTIPLAALEKESLLRATVRARSSDPDQLGLNIYLPIAGKEKAYSVNHPGDGQWHTLEHEIPLPSGAGCDQVRVLLVLRGGATDSVFIERASVVVVKPRRESVSLSAYPTPIIRPKTKDTRRLLILFPSPVRGGAEDYALTIGRGAVKDGWDVHTGFAPMPAMESLIGDFTDSGAQYHPLDVVDVGKRHDGRGPLQKRITRTMLLLRRVKPDVVMIELCGVQYGIGPMLACAILGIPSCVVFQLVRENVSFSFKGRWLRALARSRHQEYVAVSDANRTLLVQAFHMRKDAIRLIPNGANPKTFERTPAERDRLRVALRDELGLPHDCSVLITVGRLTTQKGHDVLVPAIPHIVESYPNTHFVWAGEGPLQKNLQQMIKDYGIERYVTLLGRRNDMPDLLNAADLFVHPTRFEGQPFSLIEAMAAGLPIVTTVASGIQEVIQHEEHGLLCPVDDVRALRQAVLRALRLPKEMQAMAQAAKKRADDCSEQRMVEKTLGLLDATRN